MLFIDTATLAEIFDGYVDSALEWISDHGNAFFSFVRDCLEAIYDGVLWLVQLPPALLLIVLFGLIGWRLVHLGFGLISALALVLCLAMGMWAETLSTLSLVVIATFMAIAIGLPIGILSGLVKPVGRIVDPVLDLVQTLPPYIYLLPSIALLGYGPATALVATIIIAIPPVIRLTSLGMRQTPNEFIELGDATGLTKRQMFTKIRLAFARPSILAGINQSLMMAFGMVVIAGIVGSGGLGQTIYSAIRTLDIALSINAAIAIVILTMIIDGLTQSSANKTGRT